jgi:DNA-binding CsgD family transcriptional regulator
MHVSGTPRPLPPGAELAAYRVVQEALTNVLRHGGQAATSVTVQWGENLVITVSDDGRAASASSTESPGRGLDQYVYAALAAGASGFLLKDVTPEHLVAAVQLVRTGDSLLAPSITRRLVERFTPRSVPGCPPPAGPAGGGLSTLTPRELEVLGLVARGMSNAEIAGALTLSEATVKTHVARILTKLGLRDRSRPSSSPTSAAWWHPVHPRRHRSARGRAADQVEQPGEPGAKPSLAFLPFPGGRADQVLCRVEAERGRGFADHERLVCHLFELRVAAVEREHGSTAAAGVIDAFQQRVRCDLRRHYQQ